MRLQQFEQEEPISGRTRISESEMQEVMELYDRQIGIAQQRSKPADMQATSVSELPTIGDVGEILGISEEEAQQLLQKVRTQKAERAARLRESRVPPVPHITTTSATPHTVSASPHMTTVSGQQVTVVQNVIMDSHARLFEQFNANQGRWTATWSWGAFWFGPLWYLYKGMWAKALMLFAFSVPLMVLTGATSPLIIPIILGLIGNYDYYLLRCHGSQLWDRKPLHTIPNTTVISTTPHFNVKTVHTTPTTQPTNTSVPNPSGIPANKFQVLRETYERGLLTREEFEEKRMVLLREMEHEATLKKLDEAYKVGLLTMEEYAEKRQRLLGG